MATCCCHRCMFGACARAGLHRQCIYGGLRIGLYEPVSGGTARAAALATMRAAGWLAWHSLPLRPHLACCVPLLLRSQVKQAFVGKDHVGDVPLHLKIASGLATGAIAITVASPTDLVKVCFE